MKLFALNYPGNVPALKLPFEIDTEFQSFDVWSIRALSGG